MIVLSEAAENLAPSASARDIAASTEAAKLAGCRVYSIEQDFSKSGDAEGALWHVPRQAHEVSGIWIGFIPSLDRYAEIYEAAVNKNIRLVNSPDQHRIAQEFDSAYPRLEGITPRSITVESVGECTAAAEALGFPVFVKGAVQSRKAKGWSACVAEDMGQLQALATHLFDLDARSRGRVVIRQLVQLRHHRVSPEGFRLGREFRVFVCRNKIAGLGYYWEGEDEFKTLSSAESGEVSHLALELPEGLMFRSCPST